MQHTRETPVLTDHARERCAEMGISTKVAKRLWQCRGVTWPLLDQHPRVLVSSPDFPDYVAVVDPEGWARHGGVPVIVTVLFHCVDDYVREGTTYRVIANRLIDAEAS